MGGNKRVRNETILSSKPLNDPKITSKSTSTHFSMKFTTFPDQNKDRKSYNYKKFSSH